MAQTLMYLYTESPLHAGSGSGLGTIDLPIQRERHTDFPVVQGSGLKGALRALARTCLDDDATRKRLFQRIFGDATTLGTEDDGKQLLQAVFGPDTEKAIEHAGAITVGDARLLLFPVRSLRGVFAWVTTPLILQRFQRDVELVTGQRPPWNVPVDPDTIASTSVQSSNWSDRVLVPENSATKLPEENVVLEEYTFTAQENADVDAFAQWLGGQLAGLDQWWINRIITHVVVLPGTAFRDFVLYSTEVVTRVRLDYKTKTVAGGALWTEESLPTDSLLYSPIMARKPVANGTNMTDKQALDSLRGVAQGVCQLGGDETVGRGLVRPIWSR